MMLFMVTLVDVTKSNTIVGRFIISRQNIFDVERDASSIAEEEFNYAPETIELVIFPIDLSKKERCYMRI